MTLLPKIGIGLLTASTIAGAGYAGSTYFAKDKEKSKDIDQPKLTISQLIKEKFDYILLNTEETGINDSTHWKTNWESYKNADNDVLKLEGWAEKTSDTDLTPALKKKCKSLATIIDDAIYKNVAMYCGRGVTVKDQAEKDKLVVISTDDASADNTTWQSKINKKSQLKTHLNALGITDESLTAEKLKQQCKATITKKKQEDKYQETYLAYKEVCTKLEGEQ